MGQEATVRTLYEQLIGSELRCMTGLSASPGLFNLYAEQIMRKDRLDELQAGIKTGGRSISNLRYEDDTTLVADSEEELKRLLMRVKENNERGGLRLNT